MRPGFNEGGLVMKKAFSKIFINIISLGALSTLSSPAFAQSTTFTVSSSGEQTIELSGVQEHDVFQDVLISQTCTREVFSHTETVCHDERSEVCWTEPGGERQCKPTTRRACDDVRRYRTEYYDCSYWTSVKVGTEIDYHVNATIAVKAKFPEGMSSQEQILARIDRHSGVVTLAASDTSGVFLIYLKRDSDTDIDGMQKNIRVEAELTFVEAEGIREAFKKGISGFELKAGLLSFEMPTHFFSKEVDLRISLKRQRPLWFSKKLFSGYVDDSAVEITERAETTRYTMDLTKLGMKEPLKGGKDYKVQIEVKLSDFALGGCLNRYDLSKYVSAELKLKRQKI